MSVFCFRRFSNLEGLNLICLYIKDGSKKVELLDLEFKVVIAICVERKR